jgi:hypothetical protein
MLREIVAEDEKLQLAAGRLADRANIPRGLHGLRDGLLHWVYDVRVCEWRYDGGLCEWCGLRRRLLH